MNDSKTKCIRPVFNCDVHGEYEAGEGYWRDQCPQCRHERAAHNSWARSNVPQRFRGRTRKMFARETQEQSDAYDATTDFLENFKDYQERGTNLFLCGKPGTGKTHLACALVQAVAQKYAVPVGYITALDMLRAIRSTYHRDSGDTEEKVIERFADVALLVIDEVGVSLGTDHEKSLFYAVLNKRYERFNPTIIVSNLAASELVDFLGSRVIDRLKEGGEHVIPFNGESYRGKELGLPTRSECPRVTATPFYQEEDRRYGAGAI